MDKEKVLIDFINGFLESIEQGGEIYELSKTAKALCGEYNSNPCNVDFEYINLISIINKEYNKFNRSSYQNTENLIYCFDPAAADAYWIMLNEYCEENRFQHLPDNLKIVLFIISDKFISDQNLYKYCRDLSNENADHIQSFSIEAERRIKEFENIVKEQSITVKKVSDNYKEEINKVAQENQKKTTETSISILGIFSAIVLVVNAGISLSSDILQNLICADFTKAVLIFSVFGLILGNVILGLITYLEYVRIDKEQNADELFKKVQRPLVVLNIVLTVIIVITFAIYIFGGHSETKHNGIDNSVNTSLADVTTSNVQEDLNME